MKPGISIHHARHYTPMPEFMHMGATPPCAAAPDLFVHSYTGKEGARRDAKAQAICTTCPFKEPCRAWALRQTEPLHGIWGGTSPTSRALYKKRKKARLLWDAML